MSKKKVTFPNRPCPPAGADIVSDITNASETDVVFQLDGEASTENIQCNESPPVSSLMVESFTSQDEVPFSPDPASVDQPDDRAHQVNITAIDNVYKQASQFLQVSEKLQHAPQALQEQCRHLEELGEELRQSIDTLKTQTQGLLKESACNSEVN